MSDEEFGRPLESIENAHEFIVLLEENVKEAIEDVRGHLLQAIGLKNERQVRALHLAIYKLTQLSAQMQKSRRVLNDLRTIRRLLFSESEGDEPAELAD
jgi:ABC-type protease/lipase transport system fused ATPase/permease subunit